MFFTLVADSKVSICWVMLVEYPCAMQRKKIYQRHEGNLFKCAVAVTIVLQICIDVVTTGE